MGKLRIHQGSIQMMYSESKPRETYDTLCPICNVAFRPMGGIAICGFCGFALIAGRYRGCCEQGIAEDDAAAKRAAEFMRPTPKTGAES